ncbi:MAG: hypothetical protein IIA27_15115 [Gemmatimonadetes bacterium]|nr:hypothetical protein [Gemmatimonadota bacterium]
MPTMAGTGPLYPFVATLGLPTADIGIGYPDTRIHAPDENIRIEDFRNGRCPQFMRRSNARDSIGDNQNGLIVQESISLGTEYSGTGDQYRSWIVVCGDDSGRQHR